MEDENKKMSREQKEILVSFMEDHQGFARGRLQPAEGRMTFKNLWLILAEQLNNNTGKQKTIQQWQRTWTDIKIKVKKKVSAMKASRIKTGGGSMTDVNISNFDDRVIQIISEEAIFGIEDPENILLESEGPIKENPRTESLINVADLSGHQQTSTKRNAPTPASSWVQKTEYLEGTGKKRKVQSETPTTSHISDVDDSQEEEEEVLTPRKHGRASVATAAAKQLKQIQGDTNTKIDGLRNEVGKLNDKLDILINQNDQLMTHRVQTNSILERIATALEGQYL